MKKLFIAAAAVLLCAAMGTSVSADLVVEPNDSFFMENFGDIERPYGGDGRKYVLTAETNVYADPNGKVTGKLSAGESPLISLYYTDKNGGQWGGYYDFSGDDELLWISLDGLEPVYDNYSFSEEHKDEIIEGKTTEFESLREEGTIYLWKYPGSTECSAMEKHPDNFGSYISRLYTDKQGGKWGYVNYIRGETGWFYLTDPADPAPYGEDVSAGAMTTESDLGENGSNGMLAPILLALAAAGGSGVLIACMKKKEKD
ncbi:MAG: hypothetical protein ACI4J0_02880 [Huintestinicola sp.]|uniref:hypothetical protein n=1 Tax=Huintestinicola sp. TaxID=2981661 RepID=UPI003F0A6624